MASDLLSPHAGAAVSRVGGKRGAPNWKDREHSLSCTTAHVLKVCRLGGVNHIHIFLKFLSVSMHAESLRLKGLSCTELRLLHQRHLAIM